MFAVSSREALEAFNAAQSKHALVSSLSAKEAAAAEVAAERARLELELKEQAQLRVVAENEAADAARERARLEEVCGCNAPSKPMLTGLLVLWDDTVGTRNGSKVSGESGEFGGPSRCSARAHTATLFEAV
jgi:hypothetical protein